MKIKNLLQQFYKLFINNFPIILIIIFSMTLIWGQLVKSQSDAETIEQMVDRKIAAHNAAAVAHNAPGQSLDLHRKDTIIDHPAGSVKNDKWSFDIFDYQNYFYDFSKWGNDGGFNEFANGSVLFQNPVKNGSYSLWNEFDGKFIGMEDLYSKFFGSEVVFDAGTWTSDDVVRLGFGSIIVNDVYFVGFQVEGNKVYCVAPRKNNTQYRFEIPNVNLIGSWKHSLFIRYDASERVIYWYLDGNLVNSVNIDTENLTTYLDPFPVYSVKVVNVPIQDVEFYFFNPRFSVDYSY